MKTLLKKITLVSVLAIVSVGFTGTAMADCMYAGSAYSCESDDTYEGIGTPAPSEGSSDEEVSPSEDEA